MVDTSLSVIVPIYNEQQTINAILKKVEDAGCWSQVLVVDDGSNDGTEQLLKAWRSSGNVTVLTHAENQGKGAAIRTALSHVISRFAIIQDADLEYSPSDYVKIVRPLICNESQIVYGSRFLPESVCDGIRKTIPRIGTQLLNITAKLLYGCHLTDLATCYKAFPTELLRQMDLQCKGFEFCAEVTAKACRMGIVIHEVPIQYAPRSVKQGKKIRWWHGLSMLSTLWKYRYWNPPATNPDNVR